MNKEELANNLYDLIKVNALSDKQNDDWAILSREHGNKAKKEIGKFLRHKSIEVSHNVIKIGKGITIVVD